MERNLNKKYNEIIKVNIKKTKNDGVKMFHRICSIFDKYDFDYWLDYGTLLGAIRDGTIIPWDGEFDISVWNENIDFDSKMWNEIKENKFHIIIGEYNIKIKKNDARYGTFIIDMHRYKMISNNAIYKYGYRKENNIIVEKIKNIIHPYLPLDKDYEINYASIFSALMNRTDFTIEELMNKEVFIKLNKYNYNPFTLYVDDVEIIQNYLSKKQNYLSKIIDLIAQILPSFINKQIYDVLKNLKSNKFFEGIDFIVPLEFFADFTKVDFCGISCKVPQKHDKYLKRIYGKDWRLPKYKWETSRDSPTYKINNND
jgi:phosphorylcholine metabolism protein LicD